MEFDKKGAWEEIDSHETPLSNRLVGLLPTAAIEYLNDHYPDAKIEGMEQRSNVYKLSLSRPEMKLYFTKSGEFVKQKKDWREDLSTGVSHAYTYQFVVAFSLWAMVYFY